MATGHLLSAGIFCCALALVAQLFPMAAYAIGAEVAAAWRLFAFGVFLIAVAALMTAAGARCGCAK